jgi:hypothetical protein
MKPGIDDLTPWGFTPRQAFEALQFRGYFNNAYPEKTSRRVCDIPGCESYCRGRTLGVWAMREIRRNYRYKHMDNPASVYRFFSPAGELLYVGFSGNPKNRIASHKTQSQWWGECDPEATTVHDFSTQIEALVEETRAINEELPKHNKQKNSTQMYYALKHFRLENLKVVALKRPYQTEYELYLHQRSRFDAA